MKNRLVVIDGNSLINRAYFAMQRAMITKEGIYTQGIFGFLNMLQKIEQDYEPGYMAVCFDLKAPTFRHLEYAEYKAGRKPMPPELAMEMPILKDILHAMNIKTVELEGYEADDLIGTIARVGDENGLLPLIVTGDKDALQLVSETTNVLITKRGVTDFEIYDHAKMQERYNLTPLQFIDLKGIMGDSSDNIPGIPGIGEKGGIELLTQFGSIENMLANTADIKKNGLRTKVEENSQLAVMSKRLATINRFAPIEINFEDYKFGEPNYKELIELYTKLEFKSFLSKLKVNDSEQKELTTIESKKTILKNVAELSTLDCFKDKEVYLKLFSDCSHISKPSIDGLFIGNNNDSVYVSKPESFINELISKLNSLNLKLIGHDLKNELYPLMYYGYNSFKVNFDTQIAEYVLDVSKSKYDLKTIALERMMVALPSENEYIGSDQIDMFSDDSGKYCDYSVLLNSCVFKLKDLQKKELASEELENVYYNVELPLVEVMASLELSGIKVDSKFLTDFGIELKAKINELEAKICDLAGEKFNIKSTQQLGEILFEKLGLKAQKKTKTGYSTSAEILEKLKDDHPIIPLILEYRNLTKLDSTYVEGMIPLIASDGKVHAHFQQTVTTTGRISCTEPNLQNIPVRQELGRKLRNAFYADEGYILIGADYSQIELRVLAHLAQDEGLIDAFNKGEDIHRLTASKVLGIPVDQVTSLDRSRAKAVNFGVIYGMSSFGLSSELSITRSDAEKYISEYFIKHPKVAKYMDEQKALAKATGHSTTISGRKRAIPEINSSQFMVRQLGERLAMNSPIQGSAADIIKIAMINVYNELKERFPDSKLILQVHDELIINAKLEDKEKIEELLKRNMENALKLSVKLEVAMNSAKNWYDLK